MARYFLQFSYNGKPFHGYQKQPNATSVQEVIEAALATALGHELDTVASGRTDTGVHAKTQFLHFDTFRAFRPQQLLRSLNGILPYAVAVQAIYAVPEDAHARFDATVRAYQYHIHFQKDPFLEGRSYFCPKAPNVDLMNAAASLLIGEHDFESFSKVKTDVSHFGCKVFEAHWEELSPHQIVFHVAANRFLRGMVRALSGTLLAVGQQKITVQDFGEILQAKDRKAAGSALPPEGLFLTRVQYPEHLLANKLA